MRHSNFAAQRAGRAVLLHAARVMALLLGLTAAAVASAQPVGDYPTRPITLVVPFAAGGPTDAVARHLAAAMSPLLQQPIVIDNRAGLGGTQAPAAMARGPADGYTILLHHIGMATAPALFRGLTYDPQRDFEPIGLVASAPMVLLTHPSVPATNTRQLIAYLRANEASVAMGYAGPGAASHLCGLLLTTVLRLDLIAVPYKGTGPALAALEKGSADLLCDQTTAAMPSIRNGKVKVFAVTTPERVALLPEVPTTGEQGLAGLQLTIWHGVYAPRGTPEAVVATLARALQSAVASPAFVAAMNQVGVVPTPPDQATPRHLRQMLAAQTAKWRPIIQKAGQFAD